MKAQFLSSSPEPGIVGSSVPSKADSISERKLHGEVSESGDPDDDRLVGGKVKMVEVMISVLLIAVDLKSRISTGNRVGLYALSIGIPYTIYSECERRTWVEELFDGHRAGFAMRRSER